MLQARLCRSSLTGWPCSMSYFSSTYITSLKIKLAIPIAGKNPCQHGKCQCQVCGCVSMCVCMFMYFHLCSKIPKCSNKLSQKGFQPYASQCSWLQLADPVPATWAFRAESWMSWHSVKKSMPTWPQSPPWEALLEQDLVEASPSPGEASTPAPPCRQISQTNGLFCLEA